MKRKLIIWTTISILTVIIYAIGSKWSIQNGFMYSIGILIVPLIMTLIVPVCISSIVIGVYYLFTKNKNLGNLFSKTMWTTQILALIFVFMGLMGQSIANGNGIEKENDYKSEPTLSSNDKVISNEFIEFKIPQEWEYTNSELINNQLYNIICYFEQGTLRISGANVSAGTTPNNYYKSFKEFLFSDIQKNMQNFRITMESDISFQNHSAYKVAYTATYQGVNIFGESIFISKNDHMILLGSLTNDKTIENKFNKVYNSFVIK